MPPTNRMMRSFAMRAATAAALLVTVSAGPVHAQGSVLLEGIADGEFWSTTAKSNLLTRSEGQPTGLGRVQLWGAVEPLRGLVFYAQGGVQSGPAHGGVAARRAYTEQFLRSRVGEAVLDRIPPTFTVYDEAPKGQTITAERPAAAAQED